MITLNRKGFTLVELMIVIAIMGIMLTISIPMWSRYRSNADLRDAAREIAGDFFNMKQRTITERTRYRVKFDLGNNVYQFINFSTNDVIQTKNVSEFRHSIELTGTTFNNQTVDFFTRGTTNWGSVSLKNDLESTATITINQAGRIHVSFDIK